MAHMDDRRIERDSMGEMPVPTKAYWGAQTQRAVLNFPISGYRLGRRFIRALGLIKKAAAETNTDLGRLKPEVAKLIVRAAREVIDGQLDDHFVLDVFQTGSGTSMNMNANEVIATRANELHSGKIGGKEPVHPNDHVNMGQSSNDVFPTAIHVAACEAFKNDLIPALRFLQEALQAKVVEFDKIMKIGRTHLMDATPIRLGQEFSGYAAQARKAVHRAEHACKVLTDLAIGGTAVGTGINTHPDFARQVARRLADETGVPFCEADNHFEAQAAKDALVEASGQLKAIAVGLTKIANDIRWLGSGPRCGLGEILLPATQPGSSIMPGKVNPVMSEMLIQACVQTIAADTAVTLCGRDSIFELNTMMPLMAYDLLEAMRILGNAVRVFTEKCVVGLEANQKRCEELVEWSLAMCTSLAPVIGYDKAAETAKEAYKAGKTVRQVAMEMKVLPAEQLDKILDPASMTRPG